MAIQNKRSPKKGNSSSTSFLILIAGIALIAKHYAIHIAYIVAGCTFLLIAYAIYCGSKNVQGASDEVVTTKSKVIEVTETDVKQHSNVKQHPNVKPSISVDDMQHFPDIPIAWSYITDLHYTNGIAWCQLNWNNQEIVRQYISQVNDIIVDAHDYIDGIEKCCIDLHRLDFDYPVPMHINSMCNTRIECAPYTPTGKLSKHPVTICFATRFGSDGIRDMGEIKLLRDGNIGSASVAIHGTTFKIGLHGASLVLKRVDNPYKGGNLFKLTDSYD